MEVSVDDNCNSDCVEMGETAKAKSGHRRRSSKGERRYKQRVLDEDELLIQSASSDDDEDDYDDFLRKMVRALLFFISHSFVSGLFFLPFCRFRFRGFQKQLQGSR